MIPICLPVGYCPRPSSFFNSLEEKWFLTSVRMNSRLQKVRHEKLFVENESIEIKVAHDDVEHRREPLFFHWLIKSDGFSSSEYHWNWSFIIAKCTVDVEYLKQSRVTTQFIWSKYYPDTLFSCHGGSSHVEWLCNEIFFCRFSSASLIPVLSTGPGIGHLWNETQIICKAIRMAASTMSLTPKRSWNMGSFSILFYVIINFAFAALELTYGVMSNRFNIMQLR